jgi:hypothetical protein
MVREKVFQVLFHALIILNLLEKVDKVAIELVLEASKMKFQLLH